MKFMILYIYMHIHILFVKYIFIMILYFILNDNSCFATILCDVYVCMIIVLLLVLNKGLLYTNERQIESNRIHL